MPMRRLRKTSCRLRGGRPNGVLPAPIYPLIQNKLYPVESDYVWRTIGTRDWITPGGHEVDDRILSPAA